jgi:hypothetical protein
MRKPARKESLACAPGLSSLICVLVYFLLPSACGDLLPHLLIIITLHRYPTCGYHLYRVEHFHTDYSRLAVFRFPPTSRASCLVMAVFPARGVRKDTRGTWHENHQPGRPHQKGRNTRTPHATYLEALCKKIGAKTKVDEAGKASIRVD